MLGCRTNALPPLGTDCLPLSVGDSTLAYRVGVIGALLGDRLQEGDKVALAKVLPGYVAQDICNIVRKEGMVKVRISMLVTEKFFF